MPSAPRYTTAVVGQQYSGQENSSTSGGFRFAWNTIKFTPISIVYAHT